MRHRFMSYVTRNGSSWSRSGFSSPSLRRRLTTPLDQALQSPSEVGSTVIPPNRPGRSRWPAVAALTCPSVDIEASHPLGADFAQVLKHSLKPILELVKSWISRKIKHHTGSPRLRRTGNEPGVGNLDLRTAPPPLGGALDMRTTTRPYRPVS